MNGKELKQFLLTHNDAEAAAAMGVSKGFIWRFREGLKMPSLQERRTQQTIRKMTACIKKGLGYSETIRALGMYKSASNHKLFKRAMGGVGIETTRHIAEATPGRDHRTGH